MKKSIVLLFTPGLDSFLANEQLTDLYGLNDDVTFNRVYFNLQHVYALAETELLKTWYPNSKYFTISNILNMQALETPSAYIPNRNILLLSLAQSLFDADTLYLNGVFDDRVSDNLEVFRQLAASTLSQSREKPVEVKTLFTNTEKAEAVRQFTEHNPHRRMELLTKTFSCFSNTFYEEEELSYFRKTGTNEYIEEGKTTVYGCMECTACFRKMCALTAANIYVPFFDFSVVRKYQEENAVSRDTHPNRARSIDDYYKFLNWFGCD